jgi:hypothetical protein
MFEDLYDYVSLIFSSGWPRAEGVITNVGVRQSGYRRDMRLIVGYEFSISEDGPYEGESMSPPFIGVANIEGKLCGRPVIVRYRRDDPSVNKLDRSVWQDLDCL